MEIPANIRAKIENLQSGFDELKNLSVQSRVHLVKRLRLSIVANQEHIASAIVEDTGKPISEALAQEVTAALGMLKFFEKTYPHWLKDRRFRYLRPGFWAKANTVKLEPLGVITVIGPANFPFSLPVMQSVSAFLCGNTVALKPSEKCSRTNRMLNKIFTEAEIPEKYFSIFEGDGDSAELLISSTIVKKVIFTGSYLTGRKIAELAGRHFKPVILELGNSGGAIVCGDANLKMASKGITWSAFYSNSLSCVGTRRLFVEKSAAERFVGLLKTEIENLKIGSPADFTSDISRISNTNCSNKSTLSFGDGVEIWEPGSAKSSNDLEAVTQLIICEYSDLRKQACEGNGQELLVCKVDSIEQAVEGLNKSQYGLSASVWSKNISRAKRIANQLDVGMVWINDASAGMPGFPWGGTKRSGWGRLFAKEAITELTNIKVISSERRRISNPKFWWFPYNRSKYELVLSVNKINFGKFEFNDAWELVKIIIRYLLYQK
ncbi:MAG: aldehyde dehydrogenase family protein [Bacteroidota bacterium]